MLFNYTTVNEKGEQSAGLHRCRQCRCRHCRSPAPRPYHSFDKRSRSQGRFFVDEYLLLRPRLDQGRGHPLPPAIDPLRGASLGSAHLSHACRRDGEQSPRRQTDHHRRRPPGRQLPSRPPYQSIQKSSRLFTSTWSRPAKNRASSTKPSFIWPTISTAPTSSLQKQKALSSIRLSSS